MAILKKIFRYPIKGLSGESLNETLLEKDQVLSGDREYAFARSHVSFDEKNPVYLRKTNFLALVKEEKLASLSTEFNSKSKRLIIRFDKKTVLDEILVNEININKVEVFFQKYLNLGSNNKPRLVQGTKYENDKNLKHSFSDLPEKAISIINLNTISDFEKKIEKNIDPWKEFNWIGKKIEIGDSVLEVFKRTQRCAATNVNPENALRDINIPNEINSYYGHLDLGVYAKVKKTGVISVNDKLHVN